MANEFDEAVRRATLVLEWWDDLPSKGAEPADVELARAVLAMANRLAVPTADTVSDEVRWLRKSPTTPNQQAIADHYESLSRRVAELEAERSGTRGNLVTIAAHLDAHAKRIGHPELASLANNIRAGLSEHVGEAGKEAGE